MGVLSATSSNPVQVDSNVNSLHTFNTSDVNSGDLRWSTLTCTNYSNFTGWQNKTDNIYQTLIQQVIVIHIRVYMEVHYNMIL